MRPLYPLFKDEQRTFEIIGFDTETINKKITYNKNNNKKTVHAKTNDFYMGGLYSKEEYIYFLNKEDMIQEILSNKYAGKIIVATNLGFDFNALFYETKYWSKFEIIYNGSKLISAIYTLSNKQKITFLDTGNYIQLSVEQMGEILNKPKLKKPKALGKRPKNNKEFEELIIYNKRDCEISKEFLELLQSTFNDLGGTLKLTIASTAMNVYRRSYHRFIMKHETEILKEDDYYDFLFKAYYGGRTEAFSRGKVNNAKVYDVNSLYPFAMLRSFPHPHSVKKIKDPSIENIDYYLRFKGVMQVEVTAPENIKYPYLAHKYQTKTGIKLLFPVGSWKGVYTNFELKRALELGYTINKIHKAYLYKASFFPFKEYVKDLYDLRMKYKAENSKMEIGVKLLLNSLYGKFAQRKISDVMFIDVTTMDEEEIDRFMTQSGRNIVMTNETVGIETIEKECDSSFVFPIFSIYVTAYARDVLYNYITTHNALYCDTDSILTKDILQEDRNLGAMKVEYDVLEGIVIKPKMYMYDTPSKTIVRMKGVSKAQKDTMISALKGEMVSYVKFTKLKESIRRSLKPNSIIKMKKKMKLEDDKRYWEESFNPEVLQDSKPIKI